MRKSLAGFLKFLVRFCRHETPSKSSRISVASEQPSILPLYSSKLQHLSGIHCRGNILFSADWCMVFKTMQQAEFGSFAGTKSSTVDSCACLLCLFSYSLIRSWELVLVYASVTASMTRNIIENNVQESTIILDFLLVKRGRWSSAAVPAHICTPCSRLPTCVSSSAEDGWRRNMVTNKALAIVWLTHTMKNTTTAKCVTNFGILCSVHLISNSLLITPHLKINLSNPKATWPMRRNAAAWRHRRSCSVVRK